jgi:hypothetical protein
MKFQKKFLVVALTLAGVALQSQATLYTLTDGDSSVKVNDATGSGSTYDWTIGGVNQLANQWLYYRIGATGPEYAIDSLSAPMSVLDLDGKGLTTTYSNSTIGLSIVVYFKLTDSINPGQSQFDLNVAVNNLSGASQLVNLFQYSDYNLGGDSSDQSGLFTTIRNYFQTDGAWKLAETATATGTGITVNRAVVTDGSILTSLADLNPTTLAGPISVGAGDITYAFEWSKTLAAGGTFQVSKLQGIVPEPCAGSLILSGIIAMGFRSWRRAAKRS